MTVDGEPPLVRVAGQYVFGLEVPWLPVLAGADQRLAFGRQVAMVRALAENQERLRSALQLRIVADTRTLRGRTTRVLRILLLGRDGSPAAAAALAGRLRATLPPDFVTEPVPAETMSRLLDTADAIDWSTTQVAEIRRAIESSDPESDSGDLAPMQPVLLRWEWTTVNLVASLGALHNLPPGAQLVIHLEPRPVSVPTLGWLRAEIARLAATYRDEKGSNPLIEAVVHGYRRWLRDLPRACVHLRVVLVSPGADLPVGVPEVIGADLTRSWDAGGPVGTFDVVRPRDERETDTLLSLVRFLRGDPVRNPGDPELAELMHLFDPHEASAAFRIPLPGPDGLPGLRSEPASTLPRGLSSRPTADQWSVVLGAGPSGDPVALSDDELNRHVLVAGLPGYGKTTTMTTVLRQLWTDPERVAAGRQVPFLVIDPAKTDYRDLADELGEECRLVELGADAVAFNPFVCPDDVPVSVFATRVAAAFDAAYDLSATYPAAGIVLTRAVHRMLDTPQPSLAKLYATVLDLVANSGYSDRVRSDLEAAVVNRLELLADGSLGAALMGGPDAGVDWADVMSRPVVVLTREFAGPRERALLMSLVLAGLVSYREYHPSRPEPGQENKTRLDHVTVIEEAHRMLAARPGLGVNDGAQVFVDAMAELRGAGEGIVVVEQAPSRLVPEVRKLVGTIVAHRTVDADERAVLAASLTLPESEDELARLAAGHALVLSAGMTSPALVTVERGARVSAGTAPHTSRSLSGDALVMKLWCARCPVVCRGRGGAERLHELRLQRPGTPKDDLVAAVAGNRAESYCARAYLEAQFAPSAAAWDAAQRRVARKFRESQPTTSTTGGER